MLPEGFPFRQFLLYLVLFIENCILIYYDIILIRLHLITYNRNQTVAINELKVPTK